MAGLLAIPGSAAAKPGNGKGGGVGGGGGSDPTIESLEVWATSDNTIKADYKVKDADGDLDKVALAAIDKNETVGYDYKDISGSEDDDTLETDPLDPGKYKWAFVVVDEKKNSTSESGRVTIE